MTDRQTILNMFLKNKYDILQNILVIYGCVVSNIGFSLMVKIMGWINIT